MGQPTLLLLISTLLGSALSQSIDFNNPNDIQSQLSPAYSRVQNGFWPFQKSQYPVPETRFNIPQARQAQSQRYFQQDPNLTTAQNLAIQNQRRLFNKQNPYPSIILSQDRAAYAEALRRQQYEPADVPPFPPTYQYDQHQPFQYRPTQLDYKQRPLPPAPQRPVITLGTQPKLAYGEPFLRVPYDDDRRRQPYPFRQTQFNLDQNRNREFGPFGNRGPYRTPLYTDRQGGAFPEYGPFGDTGPYAPAYTRYLPALKFRQDMNPGTGEYEVEYQTANGIYRKETGGQKLISVYNPTTRQYEQRMGSVKAGIVSWTSPEGIPFSYSFIADERGYRPSPLVQALAPEALALTKTSGYRQTVVPYQ